MINKTSFLILRLAIGTSIFGHGLVRLPKIAAFGPAMANAFQKSILPQWLVAGFGYALPIAEFSIGLLLVIGLFTKQAAIAGAVVMLMLIFGSTTIESWDGISTQLIHIAFFAAVVQFAPYDSWAVDNYFKKANKE